MSNFIPLSFTEFPPDEMLARARSIRDELRRRRSVRDFSERPVDRDVIAACIEAAGTAPNGANLQPWHFAVVNAPGIKRRIREAAEAEEREFYERRAPEDWLEVLRPLGTDANKPFLETAPYLIAIFEQKWHDNEKGERVKHYYPTESVGIATGMLITALHHAGLATLTHTPSPMKFLNEILERPTSERPFLLLVVGYPAESATVPDITKKTLEEIASWRQ